MTQTDAASEERKEQHPQMYKINGKQNHGCGHHIFAFIKPKQRNNEIKNKNTPPLYEAKVT